MNVFFFSFPFHKSIEINTQGQGPQEEGQV